MTLEGSYSPGTWTAVTTPSGWLLIDLRVTDARVADAWQVLRRAGSVDEVLDVLLHQGFEALPGFALVVPVSEGHRAIVRRPASLALDGPHGAEHVGELPGTWLDRVLVGAWDRIELRNDGAHDDGPSLPVGLGITQADRILLSAASEDDARAPRPEPETEPTPEPEAEPEPETEPEEPAEEPAHDYSDLFAGTQDRDAFLARLEAEEAAPQEDVETSTDDGQPGGDAPEPEELVPPVREVTVVWDDDHPDPLPAPGPPPMADGLIDGLPWLTGTPATPTPADPTPGDPTPADPPPAVPPPAPALAQLVDADPEDESTQLTMSRADLLAAMRTPEIVGPTVTAVRCPQGHLTPPYDDRCRTCQAPVEGGEPQEVARPPLGALRREHGAPITLDRDVVIGRAPQATASRAANQPNLVKIADPGISRNHVHVSLDGWQVLVRDLGSSNGTDIELPGREPEKLRAQEDYVIVPGTVITLAGDVRLVFEVSA